MRHIWGTALLVGCVMSAGCVTVARAGSAGDGYDDDYGEVQDDVPPPPVPPEDVAAEPAAQVSVDGFYDQLAPYGEWVMVGGYGRVWRPYPSYVGGGFRPYASGGHWVYTPYGWSFASDYPFGWAVYHYGRWALDANFGWVWVPDTVWGPAWVDWRYGGGYIGWAPLPPVGWRTTYYDPYWSFVESPVFVRTDVNVYIVPRERVRYVYQATAPVAATVRYGSHTYCPGPPAATVARVTGTRIRPVPVQSVSGHPVPVWSGSSRPSPSYPGSPHPVPVSPGGGARPSPSYPGRGSYQGPVPSSPSASPVMMDRRRPSYAQPVNPNPPAFQRYSPPAVTRTWAPPAYQQRGPAPTFRPAAQAPAFRPAPVQQHFSPAPQRAAPVRPGRRH